MGLNSINVSFWEKLHNKDSLGKKTADSYACKCDICGDSAKGNKKRLILYTKPSFDGDFVKCFNCGFSSTMYGYIKHQHPSYLQEYRNSFSNELLDGLVKLKKTEDLPKLQVGASFSKTRNTPEVFFDLNQLAQRASENSEASEYIKRRGANPQDFYYVERGIETPEGYINLKGYILYPFSYFGKHYGFYSRSIKDKHFRTYVPKANTGFKAINMFNIDKTKPCFIFEGIFDALCCGIPNFIAMCGATLPDDFIKTLKRPVFCLDNDKRGYDEMRNLLKRYPDAYFCLWGDDNEYKGFKDFNDIFCKKGVDMKQFIKSHLDNGITAETRLEMLVW